MPQWTKAVCIGSWPWVGRWFEDIFPWIPASVYDRYIQHTEESGELQLVVDSVMNTSSTTGGTLQAVQMSPLHWLHDGSPPFLRTCVTLRPAVGKFCPSVVSRATELEFNTETIKLEAIRLTSIMQERCNFVFYKFIDDRVSYLEINKTLMLLPLMEGQNQEYLKFNCMYLHFYRL